MQHRALRLERIARPQRHGKRLVVDLDQLQRVLGEIAVGRDHHGDRLADIAHPLHRDRPALDIRLDACEQRRPERRHLGRRDDGRDAARSPRGRHIDRADDRMRMRRAQHRGMQGAGRHADIVDKTAAPGEQACVFDALDRLADPGLNHAFPSGPHCCRNGRLRKLEHFPAKCAAVRRRKCDHRKKSSPRACCLQRAWRRPRRIDAAHCRAQ